MKKTIANWGNFPVIESDETGFSFDDELPGLFSKHAQLIPRGSGRSYGDAGLANEVVSTLKYDKMLFFDTKSGIFECQSGVTLEMILEVIVPKGWFLPVTPGTKFITIGGAVAGDVHGKNHHVDGSFCSHIVNIHLMLEDGSIIKCSSGVNTDLFHATCGGMGLTGLILRVRLRLHKIETAYISQKQIKAENLDHVISLFDEYRHYKYSVAWIDCLKKGKAFGRSILVLGEHATPAQLTGIKKAKPFSPPKQKHLTLPFNLPSWLLNSYTVRIFNSMYYGKNSRKEIDNIVGYESFFYPLDTILHWNRGYGKHGFVQYQFVLPLSAKDGLKEILNRISDDRPCSFLAVLKVFGKQESIISFPTEGYTLALDFPVRDNLLPFLDELDKIVVQHGGRLYMSKDARMKPDILRAGYPRLEEFRTTLKKYNPGGKFRSIQSDRLGLTPNS